MTVVIEYGEDARWEVANAVSGLIQANQVVIEKLEQVYTYPDPEPPAPPTPPSEP